MAVRPDNNLFSFIENNLPRRCRIAIGVNDDRTFSMLEGIDEIIEPVFVTGSKVKLKNVGGKVIVSDKPEQELVDLLMNDEVDAAIRGSLPASSTLSYLKRRSGITNLARVALLKPVDLDPFLFAPVGIDEGDNFEDRLRLIENGIRILENFGMKARIGILSGGRLGDTGRSARVDRSLEEGKALVDVVSQMGYPVHHHEILIEDAVRESNLIIAPDGISGNLIFRTLTFLGRGSAWGAAVHHELGKTFVDTSRAGGSYSGSVKFAAVLSRRFGVV